MAKNLGDIVSDGDYDTISGGAGPSSYRGSIMTGLLVLSIIALIVGLYMLISTRDTRSSTRDVATGLAFFGAVGTIYFAATCAVK